ncbi:MAG: hypothetical protein ACYTEQ_18765 [Planctomycetota bacterium]
MTTNDMKSRRHNFNRPGTALLVVLFVVMAATILSLGFLCRSEVELSCGRNIVLRTQMDYLAESGLEHARGLILNPQDVSTEYWAGAVQQKLVAGSDDYYDVNVVKLAELNYRVTCDAYRQIGAETTGRSSLEAELRLDPCIAYWAGASAAVPTRVTVNGDVYCSGNLSGSGIIGGDVFATGTISASNVQGRANEAVTAAPVDWPGLNIADFSSSYHIGSDTYGTAIIDSNVHPGGAFSPSAGNPGGVRYYNGDLELSGGVNITGMLVVDGNLGIRGTNNVVQAVKNFPALLVSGELVFEDGGTLDVVGLAQVGRRIVIRTGAANVDLDVNGALFVANGGIEGVIADTTFMDIFSAPALASIEVWPSPGTATRWSPAAGAFFRSIARK